MKKTILNILMSAGVVLGAASLMADKFTPLPGTAYDSHGNLLGRKGSDLQTQIRLEVKENTDQIHMIHTNNDPMIITKTYVLKHADPYELRPYIRAAVQTERITGGNKQTGGFAKVECIKYNDGTGIMIVSAEDYRFQKQKFGMGIDEIIERIDQPGITSSSGTKTYVYFPKYWDAKSLLSVVKENGMNVKNDPYELTGGKDKGYADPDLNAILFYTPQYSRDNVLEMLKLYDSPTFEVDVKYTVYELNTEKDNKVGADFQAWRNGPGANIFSTAGRFGYGWTGDVADGIINGTKNSTTKFIKFSPRWNTRYLDFLSARGKAKVMTSGRIAVMHNSKGLIENTTTIPRFADGHDISDLEVEGDYMIFEQEDFVTSSTSAASGVKGDLKITATDKNGYPISTTAFHGTVTVGRYNAAGVKKYYLEINKGSGSILHSGKGGISRIQCYNLKVQECKRYRTIVGVDPTNGGGTGGPVYSDSYKWVTVDDWNTDQRMTVMRDVERDVTGQQYGFSLSMVPIIGEEATTMDIAMQNVSLVGFSDNGEARTTVSQVKTKVMVSNKGQKFVIGGLEKKDLVRGVSKVPWLGSLPGLGWLLGSESESTKRSEIVCVIECTPVNPDTKVAENIISTIVEPVEDKTKEAGVPSNFKDSYLGFDQFLFDKEKKNFDPLP